MSTASDLAIFIAQKVVDKRKGSKEKMDKYSVTFEKKIEHSLELFIALNMAVVNESNEVMTDCLKQYNRSFRDVYFYFEQHELILKAYKPKMERLKQIICIDSHRTNMLNEGRISGYEAGLSMRRSYNEINTLLKEVQAECVSAKV
ncbi:MAG: hypothetical protein LUI61_01845 [Firmicutes bacterium]|nr:hypothetical protein [Bacillota bacterium]